MCIRDSPLGEAVPGELIRSMEDLDDHQKRMLLGGTAERFLGMNAGGDGSES